MGKHFVPRHLNVDAVQIKEEDFDCHGVTTNHIASAIYNPITKTVIFPNCDREAKVGDWAVHFFNNSWVVMSEKWFELLYMEESA